MATKCITGLELTANSKSLLKDSLKTESGLSSTLTKTGKTSKGMKPEMTESDPFGKSSKEEGSKLDAGKPSLYRGVVCYFPRALERVAEVSAFGANKYTWGGWRSVPDGYNRYSDALSRHLTKEQESAYDSDSGLLHATHAAWNALARLEILLDGTEGQRAVKEEEPYGEDALFWGIREEGC